MSGPLGNIFSTADNITTNQSLIKPHFTLINLRVGNEKEIFFNEKDSLLLIFKDLNDDFTEDISFFDKNKSKSFFLILNDSTNFKKHNLFLSNKMPVYYCDTSNLPFKYKKILRPYSVLVKDGKIIKTSLGGIKMILENEK